MKCHPFYKTAEWQRARRQALHDAGYACMRCHTPLIGKGRAAHVHHRKPYLKSPALGTEPLNLKPLCRSCHDAEHHAMKRGGGCDDNGRPMDREHPWFVETKTASIVGIVRTAVAVATRGSMYNQFNHYWLADDGRLYGSAKQIITDEADADYVAWTDEGNRPSPWPRDLDSTQTEATMQAVVGPMGQFVNLKYYCVDKRWRKEQGGIVATAGFPIKTDDRSQAKITGLYAASKEAPEVVTPYHAADDTIYDLDAAAIYQLNVDLLTHINNCFAVSADVLAEIDAGTITTRDQVDAAFNAATTRARKDWMGGVTLPRPGV